MKTIQNCPACNTRVIPKSDGMCPSCREYSFRDDFAKPIQPETPDKPVKQEDELPPVSNMFPHPFFQPLLIVWPLRIIGGIIIILGLSSLSRLKPPPPELNKIEFQTAEDKLLYEQGYIFTGLVISAVLIIVGVILIYLANKKAAKYKVRDISKDLLDGV